MEDRPKRPYCNIFAFLQAHHKNYAEAIEGLCLHHLLNPGRHNSGITLLVPPESVVAEILKLSQSLLEEENTKARDRILAHIVKDVFKKPSDWVAKKDNIPNSLFPSQKVEVDSATTKEVTFKFGGKAAPDPLFADSSRGKNLAVWIVSKEVPVTTDKPAVLKSARPPRAETKKRVRKETVEGQGEANSRKLREQICKAVEGKYESDHRNKVPFTNTVVITGACINFHPEKKVITNAYLEHTLSLISYLLKNDEECFYDLVVPVLSFQNIDFYYLLEPYSEVDEGCYLIPSHHIETWWTQDHPPYEFASLVSQVWQKIETATSAAAIYDKTKKQDLLEKIDNLREKVVGISDGYKMVEEIGQHYKKLNEENCFDSVEGVYPEGYAGYLKKNPCAKMLQDELRFLSVQMFADIESKPVFDAGMYKDTKEFICYYLQQSSLHSRRAVLRTLGRALKYMISPTDRMQELLTFVRSTCFFFVPLTPSDSVDYERVTNIEGLAMSEDAILDITHAGLHKMKCLSDLLSALPNDEIVKGMLEYLLTVDTSRLPRELTSKLETKLKSLPQ